MEGHPNLYNTTAGAPSSSKASTSTAPSGPTTHRGNCHCGHTRYKVTLPEPFPTYKINRCTCTVCSKNGYLLVYPRRHNVEWVSGYEDLGEYRFGKKEKIHKFCKLCGSSILIDFCLQDKFPGDLEKDKLGFNMRMFTDVDLETDELDWEYFDGTNILHPKYDKEAIWAASK